MSPADIDQLDARLVDCFGELIRFMQAARETATELEAERTTVHACPNGCGTLIPTGIHAAVEAHMKARKKAEADLERLVGALDRFLNQVDEVNA